MALFLKISRDGKSVSYCKTLFANEISESYFNKNCERITVAEFGSVFFKNIDNGIKEKIKRVREIAEMKLSALGRFSIYNENKEIIGTGYLAGDEVIDEGYVGNSVRDEAVLYAKRFYGSEFAKENLDKLDNDNVTYFSKENIISFDEYDKLMKELKELTKMFAVKKEIKIGFKR